MAYVCIIMVDTDMMAFTLIKNSVALKWFVFQSNYNTKGCIAVLITPALAKSELFLINVVWKHAL